MWLRKAVAGPTTHSSLGCTTFFQAERLASDHPAAGVASCASGAGFRGDATDGATKMAHGRWRQVTPADLYKRAVYSHVQGAHPPMACHSRRGLSAQRASDVPPAPVTVDLPGKVKCIECGFRNSAAPRYEVVKRTSRDMKTWFLLMFMWRQGDL